jgi:Tfp pilus assembly protein PilN
VTWTVPAIRWLAVGEALRGRSRQVVFAATVMPLLGLPAPLAIGNLTATSTTAEKSRTIWRLYFCETLLQGLAQHLGDVAAELRQLIQKEHAVVRQGHLTRQQHLAAAEQGVMPSSNSTRRTYCAWILLIYPLQGFLDTFIVSLAVG